MHRLTHFVCFGLVVALTSASAQERLVVSPSAVRLAVALPRSADSLWTWYRPTSPNGRMEYGWFFVVPGTPEFSVGWMLFKKPGDRPASGTLGQMLNVGQRSAFGGGQRAQLLRRVTPLVHTEGDSIILEIRDSSAIAEIFGSKPDTAWLQILSPDMPSSRRKVRVVYVPMPNEELNQTDARRERLARNAREPHPMRRARWLTPAR